MKWTSWVTALVLAGIVAVVVLSSLSIGSVRCEVCMEFRGRRVCRAVDGNDEHEARSAAITNACALLASGVTDTIACQNTPPSEVRCGGS
ncbi:MAG TPA: hypothetical protein VNO26_06040 [Candidatus Limnocylindria bacterium]|nr:hypothetical protein [Candidatus Limnocylindria bacterium]